MRKFVALAAAASLSACNFAPQYRQPPTPVSAAFPEAQGGSRLATEIGWREFFGDAQLRALIETALISNQDLAQAVARIEQARAQYRIQDASRLPELGGQAGAGRSRTSAAQSGSGGAVTRDQFNIGVAVPAFELDFWGRVRNLNDAARARYLATVEAERAFRLSLIGQVAATYLTVRSAEERIVLAERSVASRREGLRIAQRRLDAGVTSTVDYDQAALLVTQAETEKAEVERARAQASNLLTVLVGGPIGQTLPTGNPVTSSGQFRDIDPGLPSALLANRPDILAAEQQLRAANGDIGAARAAFFPNISLTGNAGWASTELGDLFKGPFQSWSFGGALNLPIFDWGRREAQLDVSKARAEELTAAYSRAVQEAFREVADALAGRRTYADQIAAQERAVASQRRLAQTARLRYDNGVAIYLEVLDAERNLFAAEQQLLALRTAELQNGVSLYIALGGGLK
jgi:multidrug efflux system outer membrane protein